MVRKKRVCDTNTETGNIFGSYRASIKSILDEFNSSQDLFRVEYRVLLPSSNQYELDRRGIIIEHYGKLDNFENDFENCFKEIDRMSHKLDKRSSLFEYSFRTEL